VVKIPKKLKPSFNYVDDNLTKKELRCNSRKAKSTLAREAKKAKEAMLGKPIPKKPRSKKAIEASSKGLKKAAKKTRTIKKIKILDGLKADKTNNWNEKQLLIEAAYLEYLNIDAAEKKRLGEIALSSTAYIIFKTGYTVSAINAHLKGIDWSAIKKNSFGKLLTPLVLQRLAERGLEDTGAAKLHLQVAHGYSDKLIVSNDIKSISAFVLSFINIIEKRIKNKSVKVSVIKDLRGLLEKEFNNKELADNEKN